MTPQARRQAPGRSELHAPQLFTPPLASAAPLPWSASLPRRRAAKNRRAGLEPHLDKGHRGAGLEPQPGNGLCTLPGGGLPRRLPSCAYQPKTSSRSSCGKAGRAAAEARRRSGAPSSLFSFAGDAFGAVRACPPLSARFDVYGRDAPSTACRAGDAASAPRLHMLLRVVARVGRVAPRAPCLAAQHLTNARKRDQRK